MPAIIHEDVQEFVGSALRYAGWVFDRVDPIRRLTDVVILVHLAGAGWMPWRTRSEHEASPSSGSMGMSSDAAATVELTPPRRHRQALTHDADRMEEWLVHVQHDHGKIRYYSSDCRSENKESAFPFPNNCQNDTRQYASCLRA